MANPPGITEWGNEMTSTERDELVLLMAYDFEALADAARPYRGITCAQRAELTKWLALEFRRLAKTDGDKHGCCVVDRCRFVVRMQAQPVAYQNVPPAVVPPTFAGLMVAPGIPALYVGTLARAVRNRYDA